MLTKQEILLGKGSQPESSRVKEPRRPALPRGLARSLWFHGDGIVLSLANHFNSEVLPGAGHLVQPRWMPVRRILGGGQTFGISFDLSQILLVGG